MDEPEFYRDDLQAFYDMQVVQLRDPDEALAALRKHFKLKKPVTITPTGEVRVAGVTDDPKPPRPGTAVPAIPPGPLMPPGGEEKAKEEKPADTEESAELLPVLEAADRLERKRKFTDRREALEHATLYGRFNKLVNMSAREIREHLESPDLRHTLDVTRRRKAEAIEVGRNVVREALALKSTPVEEWTPELWGLCERVVKTIERERRSSASTIDDGKVTRKTLTLRTWGHDPLRESVMPLDEFETLYRYEPALAMRLVDASATDGPTALVESAETHAPKFKTLKANRKTLTTEERAACLKAKAVWHFNGQDKPTPAVWRSEVDGETYFVTNTHRAYNVAPTLEGAIGRFHKFIKSTA